MPLVVQTKSAELYLSIAFWHSYTSACAEGDIMGNKETAKNNLRICPQSLPVSRDSVVRLIGLFLTYVGSVLCVSVPTLAFKMINSRWKIEPYDSVRGAMLLGRLFRLK